MQIQEQKYYDAHCKIVHWNGHAMTHMRLWSSMMMQNIRTKQSEEKGSLHQYNYLAGRRKTVPLACRSGDWIESPTQSIRWLPPVVNATVRIFSSRTDSPQSLSFQPVCRVPKIVFTATSCPRWKRHALTSKPGHTVVTALWMAVSKSAQTIVAKTFTPVSSLLGISPASCM